jgi:exosome complex component RRP4
VLTLCDDIRGHGTYVDEDGNLISSVAGVVERVNKLVSVRALKSRYTGDVGDVVVGRVTEVGQSRWRVDVNGRQDAVLQLGAVNLPGGAARVRNPPHHTARHSHSNKINQWRVLSINRDEH